MEPILKTEDRNIAIRDELRKREPLFHHPEFGRTKEDFRRMTTENYWEIGASGKRYSRNHVIETVASRYSDPSYCGIHSSPENKWELKAFYCVDIAPDNYLVTYTLIQGERVTRRSTIWRNDHGEWKIFYHQGTVVEPEKKEG